ncbi:MAG: hypothetical protein ACJAZF_004889, partial [Granulosicoccus sp.]
MNRWPACFKNIPTTFVFLLVGGGILSSCNKKQPQVQ